MSIHRRYNRNELVMYFFYLKYYHMNFRVATLNKHPIIYQKAIYKSFFETQQK